MKCPPHDFLLEGLCALSDLHKQDAIKSNSANSYLLRRIETIGLFFVKISSQIRHSYVEFDFEFVGFPVNDPL